MKSSLIFALLLTACVVPPPAPNPTTTPTPSPTPKCIPAPKSVDKMQPNIHNRPSPGKVVLDVTPKVCDLDYCNAIGFTGRECCPTRQEGDPVMASCEALVLGKNKDGVVGPTWSFTGPGRMQAHPTNPYLLFIFGNGTAKACSNIEPVVCGTVEVKDNN